MLVYRRQAGYHWLIVIFLLSVFFVTPVVVRAQSEGQSVDQEPPRTAVILSATASIGADGQSSTIYRAKLLDQPNKGQEIIIGDDESASVVGNHTYVVGDKVVLTVIHHISGTDRYFIYDNDRRQSLLWLVAIFIAAITWFSRWRGVRSLISLAFSFVVIIGWIVPMIVQGDNPVFVTLVGSTAVLMVGFLLNDGFHRSTLAAGAGTVLTMIIIGGLSFWAINFSQLTGTSTEETLYLQNIINGTIDLRGLLLAGIIIGTLGILDDIAISQVAMVGELWHANPRMKRWEVYRAAMRVGQSHMAAIVNTLVLAYAGSALPLLVLFSGAQQSGQFILNGELIATEIVRSIIGSLGLVLALPITTAMAVWLRVKTHGHTYGMPDQRA